MLIVRTEPKNQVDAAAIPNRKTTSSQATLL